MIDPRLTHFIVCDGDYWGIGRTKKEALRHRRDGGGGKIHPERVYYHVTPNTKIDHDGKFTVPKGDPAPISMYD